MTQHTMRHKLHHPFCWCSMTRRLIHNVPQSPGRPTMPLRGVRHRPPHLDLGPALTSDLNSQPDRPLSNLVEPSMHLPRNFWQVAKLFIADIDHWRRCHRWFLKPAWGRQRGCYSAPRKLPQFVGSSVVSIMLLFNDVRYGL